MPEHHEREPQPRAAHPRDPKGAGGSPWGEHHAACRNPAVPRGGPGRCPPRCHHLTGDFSPLLSVL